MVDQIKLWLRRKPASRGCANSLVRVRSILVVDGNGLVASASSRRICHELDTTALLEADEPEDSLLDCPANGEGTVILKEDCLLVAESLGDALPFLLDQNNASKAIIDGKILDGVNEGQ